MVNHFNVVFRVDASIAMGSGHVMRCLALADGLTAKGAKCHFICREHSGNLISLILGRGYKVYSMVLDERGDTLSSVTCPPYLHWLGTTQALDAEECLGVLEILQPEWVIVDHYALDITWETQVKACGSKLMTIDDLANRQHNSDILLDQTYGRNFKDYLSLVPPGCLILCGSKYALLRPDFMRFRPYSLNRRSDFKLEKLLISMGGVDKDNVTRKILEALEKIALPKTCSITIVMGATAPWLGDILEFSATLPWAVEVKVNVDDMAQLMSDSDFAIGAAGATSWERCCLGLPAVMVVLADNQKFAADLLELANAVIRLSLEGDFVAELSEIFDKVINDSSFLRAMSGCASLLVKGDGCVQVVESIVGFLAPQVDT